MSRLSNFLAGQRLLAPILAYFKGVDIGYVLQMAEQVAAKYAINTLNDNEKRARIEHDLQDRLVGLGVVVPISVIHAVVSIALVRVQQKNG